jgi:hypothetical protein
MSGYAKPCRYCGELVPPDSQFCPSCAKVNPLEQRCPRCRVPVKEGWKVCTGCGLALVIVCPTCGKSTFFDDYCKECGNRIIVKCQNCGTEQAPLGPNCVKCKKPWGGRK